MINSFAISAIYSIGLVDRSDSSVCVWENILLVNAESIELAMRQVTSFVEENLPSESLLIENKPAIKQFIGFRYAEQLDHPIAIRTEPPVEITFNEYMIAREDIEKLADGLEVPVIFSAIRSRGRD